MTARLPPLTPAEIERINAAGPYNHGVWRGRGVVISAEGSITGRAQYLVDTIRAVLTNRFTPEQLSAMSIVDVGCYDGWVLEQLSDLPFSRMVGIEPRERNIDKGRTVREVLAIPSRVEYRVGALDTLGDEQFDVVLCLGVLHHVESIADALRNLRTISRDLLFVETQCLSNEHEERAAAEIEPKDLAYFGREKLVGVIGYKFETAALHGSTDRDSIVSVPSLGALRMFMEDSGFDGFENVTPPGSHWGQEASVKRAARACCVIGRASEKRPGTQANDYEASLAGTVLSEALLADIRTDGSPANSYVFGDAPASAAAWSGLSPALATDTEREIVRNLRHAPGEKIALERAKRQFADGDFNGAIASCESITGMVNADWRSCYRAFRLMAECFEKTGDPARALRYRELHRLSL
jgi:SAM-dependent methyltransferase